MTLWDMLTNSEKLSRCFLPVSGNLQVGGRFQFEGNAGGEILDCEPHKRIFVTWEMHGQESWVELLFEQVNGGVSLTLLHTASVPDEMWNQFGPGAVGIGWELGFFGLAKFIESQGTSDSSAGRGWLATEDGQMLVRGSSDGWARASIDSGTPESNALAAANVVTGFYIGAK